jgi:hypothetical protein
MGYRDMQDPAERFRQALLGHVNPTDGEIAAAMGILMEQTRPNSDLATDYRRITKAYPRAGRAFCEAFVEAFEEIGGSEMNSRIMNWVHIFKLHAKIAAKGA